MVVVALDMPMDVSSSIIMVVMVVMEGKKWEWRSRQANQNQWLKLFGLIGPESSNIPAFIFIEVIVRVIFCWGVKTSCFDPQNLDGRQP